ncbi:hypothetical protein NQ315_005054 [Exocentrus adspersus]|uniref:Uncharacterized protein n=1 Tax=Exocentrus adspersus TaxID=1586481 RepID=A0AAV8VQS9_9CUCU|nr:hypothetical protein NQ315_005054 [Exocentrus adspersus]
MSYTYIQLLSRYGRRWFDVFDTLVGSFWICLLSITIWRGEACWATYRNRQLAINLPQTYIMEHNKMLEGIESHSVLGMVSDGLPVRINLDLPYNILLPGRDEWERIRTDLLRTDSCWYTDGSKTPESAGDGAEIHATELCGRELEKRGPSRRSIKIFSDSQAALKPLGSYRCTSKAVWNCQQTV